MSVLCCSCHAPHTGRRTLHTASTLANRAIYNDRGLIVVNKPPGLTCQSSPADYGRGRSTGGSESVGNGFGALLDGLRVAFDLKNNPFGVHRLDKGTTGCFVLARTQSQARELSRQFKLRDVGKTYLALVRGSARSFAHGSGQLRQPLSYIDGRGSLSQNDREPSWPAETDWELVASSTKAPVSLLRLQLLTGQKHQLRIHLAKSLHAPIIGDDTYSHKELSPAITEACVVPKSRLMLHASRISLFRYMKSGRRVRLEVVAPLPADFIQMCHELDIPVDSGEVKGGLFADGVQAREIAELDGRWLN
ncbi:hypothetical protein PLICRDRAFT_138716 [Plicaturopsis crispa FD-325 SS-3]|nr:hypothetical protein PLICRDRAFT_138716 [Plicaturopsis crispa FD-325 SS-3]